MRKEAFLIVAMVCIIVILYIDRLHGRTTQAINASAIFEVRAEEMDGLAAKAIKGDCDAAYRLGKHHSYFSLQWKDAIKWFRIAAKCPGTAAKEELVAALLAAEDSSAAEAEINKLVREIKQIDPAIAARIEEMLRNRRDSPPASGPEIPKSEKIAIARSAGEGRLIALNAFKVHTKNKIKGFSVRLVSETDQEWVFHYDDLENGPRPGSDLLVIVDKYTGAAEVLPGL